MHSHRPPKWLDLAFWLDQANLLLYKKMIESGRRAILTLDPQNGPVSH